MQQQENKKINELFSKESELNKQNLLSLLKLFDDKLSLFDKQFIHFANYKSMNHDNTLSGKYELSNVITSLKFYEYLKKLSKGSSKWYVKDCKCPYLMDEITDDDKKMMNVYFNYIKLFNFISMKINKHKNEKGFDETMDKLRNNLKEVNIFSNSPIYHSFSLQYTSSLPVYDYTFLKLPATVDNDILVECYDNIKHAFDIHF